MFVRLFPEEAEHILSFVIQQCGIMSGSWIGDHKGQGSNPFIQPRRLFAPASPGARVLKISVSAGD